MCALNEVKGMKIKMKKIKTWLPYLLLFVLFSIVMFLSPISGDDWGNYLVGSTGLYHSIGNAVGMYFDWEGRFVSRILINILTYHKLLWNILNSIVLVSIVYLIVKMIKPKNKKIVFLLSLLIILCMNIYTFSQVVTWIAGNITYLFVIPLLLYYFYKILYTENNKKTSIIILMTLNFIIPMFVEHVAAIVVVFNLLINIYSLLKTRKLNKKYALYLFISLASLMIMFLSPGSLKRAKIENIEFNQLSLFGKIIYNLPHFIYYTFMSNHYMILLMIVANYYLLKNKIKHKSLKVISYIYFLFFPVIIIVAGLIHTPLLAMIKSTNNMIIFYFISYILFDLYLFILPLKNEKNNLKLLFYLLGILSNCIMLLSPTWGYRTGFLSYLFLAMSFIMVIDYFYKEKKVVISILRILAIGMLTFYMIFYVNIFIAQKEREKSIQRQKENDIIEIERFPDFANCNINPDNEFHIGKFKEYYKIPADKQLKLIDGPWKFKIFYQCK